MGALAAARAPQEVDREVRRDPVEPGVQGVLRVVAVNLAPDPQEDHLRHVAGVLDVADDPARQGDHRGRLPGDEDFEADHVALAGADGEVPIGQLPGLPAFPLLAVDELHGLSLRETPLLTRYTDRPPSSLGLFAAS